MIPHGRCESGSRPTGLRHGLLLAATCAAALALSSCAKKDAGDADPKPTAQVKTAVLADASLARTLTAYGAVQFAAGAERTLSAPVESKVEQVLASAGSPVSAGQTVIVLSASPQTQVDLKKAADDATTAQAALDRALRLKASGLDSNADVETARATNVVAQATLASLRSRAAGLVVSSPVSGVVESVAAAPGDLVATGAALAKIGKLGAVRVRLGVEPEALAQVHAGQTVELKPTGAETPSPGVVQALDPQIDAQTRLVGVLVSAPGAAFAAGQAVQGVIVLGHASGPAAPHAAVYYDQDQPYVLVVQGGVAHRRDVKLGPEEGGEVALDSGVKAGERIVVEGGASLDDGTAVKEAPGASDTAKGEAAGA